MFAAAIASGGITDLNSFYLTVNRNSGKPDMWRFQSRQWRMERSPFEAPDLYNASSPLYNASKIKTPLLLWTGKEDEQVDPRQSVELHMALRALKKKSIMLLYPDEGHVIASESKQLDVNGRVLEWFSYFLKDEHHADWISNGMM